MVRKSVQSPELCCLMQSISAVDLADGPVNEFSSATFCCWDDAYSLKYS